MGAAYIDHSGNATFPRGIPRDHFVWQRVHGAIGMSGRTERFLVTSGSRRREQSFPFRPRCPPTRAGLAAAPARGTSSRPASFLNWN